MIVKIDYSDSHAKVKNILLNTAFYVFIEMRKDKMVSPQSNSAPQKDEKESCGVEEVFRWNPENELQVEGVQLLKMGKYLSGKCSWKKFYVVSLDTQYCPKKNYNSL